METNASLHMEILNFLGNYSLLMLSTNQKYVLHSLIDYIALMVKDAYLDMRIEASNLLKATIMYIWLVLKSRSTLDIWNLLPQSLKKTFLRDLEYSIKLQAIKRFYLFQRVNLLHLITCMKLQLNNNLVLIKNLLILPIFNISPQLRLIQMLNLKGNL